MHICSCQALEWVTELPRITYWHPSLRQMILAHVPLQQATWALSYQKREQMATSCACEVKPMQKRQKSAVPSTASWGCLPKWLFRNPIGGIKHMLSIFYTVSGHEQWPGTTNRLTPTLKHHSKRFFRFRLAGFELWRVETFIHCFYL